MSAMDMDMDMDIIDDSYVFEDFFPSMIESVGYEGLMKELCDGFILLMDVSKGLITFESLKRSSFELGLHDLGEDEIICMLSEGDMDGDGALDQMEFCILMLRLISPAGSGSDSISSDSDGHGPCPAASSNLRIEEMGLMEMTCNFEV